MEKKIEEVLNAVNQWQVIAKALGISRAEQELMNPAFKNSL